MKPSRHLRLTLLAVVGGLLLNYATGIGFGQTTTTAAKPAVKTPVTIAGSATAPDSTPIKIIELRGDNAAIGQAHGKALAPIIKELNTKYLGQFLTSPTLRALAGTLAMNYESKLLPEHLAEIRALAAATSMSESDAMLDNCFLDLLPQVACSTITLPADAAPDHVARFARNLDFGSFNIADKNTVVLIYHPKGRFSFATIGWPGMIGAVSGMNEYGLTLSNMEVPRGPGLVAQAMPYTLLYRCVLEQCKTVAEAVKFLQVTPRQTANNLMLMDASGARAVVEITPEKITVRPGQAGVALISTNHQRGLDTDTTGKCDRYDYLNAAAHETFGKIGQLQLIGMLKHVEQTGLTMQSMIFEPTNRVVYLATGSNSAERKFLKIDLAAYFK
ncbi:MAG TPA: C45 family peptidase [Opitutales bacterium]|jgi:hypothetical protein|nr:C45 family peptidase [Opitutales bacterium]